MQVMTPRAFLKAALEHKEGYCVTFLDEVEAVNFRMACYTTRSRQRKTNARVYIDEIDYVPFTEWDGLKFKLEQKQGVWVLYANHIDLYLEHTLHGPLTPEMLERLEKGQPIAMDNLSPVDKGDGVDNG